MGNSNNQTSQSKKEVRRHMPLPQQITNIPNTSFGSEINNDVTSNELPGFSFEYSFHCEFVTDTKCCICFEPYCEGMIMQMIECNHVYHKSCLQQWYQKSTKCPLCCQ